MEPGRKARAPEREEVSEAAAARDKAAAKDKAADKDKAAAKDKAADRDKAAGRVKAAGRTSKHSSLESLEQGVESCQVEMEQVRAGWDR